MTEYYLLRPMDNLNRGYRKHDKETRVYTRLNTSSKVLPIVTSTPPSALIVFNLYRNCEPEERPDCIGKVRGLLRLRSGQANPLGSTNKATCVHRGHYLDRVQKFMERHGRAKMLVVK